VEYRSLLHEKLAEVCECFELKSVACGIEEDQGGLFAYLALESNIGFDDEGNPCIAKAIRECLPPGHRQNYPEVWNGDVMTINGIVMSLVSGARLQVCNDLVAEESKSIHCAELRPSGQPSVVP